MAPKKKQPDPGPDATIPKGRAKKIVELMYDAVWENQIRTTDISDITTSSYEVFSPSEDEYVHVVFVDELTEEQRTAIGDRWTTSATQDALRQEVRNAKVRLSKIASGEVTINSLATAVPEIRFMARVIQRLVEQEEQRLFPS